ncbi:NfeD family protein [Dissulfurispira sp.]|uniref:NfeD family protein n=1 Tax=Dissulfurispira sp. TaxID=2817609 RepID=UPI002FDB5105
MHLTSVYIWAIAGIALMAVEMVFPTFVTLFLGIGAICAALTSWAGITPHLPGQLIVFSSASLLTMLFFRNAAKKMFGKKTNAEYSEYIGEKAVVTSVIQPGGEGRISYRGTEWIAFSDSDSPIPQGSKVEIISMDGIRLKVKMQ